MRPWLPIQLAITTPVLVLLGLLYLMAGQSGAAWDGDVTWRAATPVEVHRWQVDRLLTQMREERQLQLVELEAGAARPLSGVDVTAAPAHLPLNRYGPGAGTPGPDLPHTYMRSEIPMREQGIARQINEAGPVITGDMPLSEFPDDYGDGYGPVPDCCEDCDEALALDVLEADLGPVVAGEQVPA
ncbi:hypothetical protein ACIBF5_09675 [Micromonospora sp. NPDC050417]|uniref:hypothetical protein n=1 Tax=Micromonospora sp. NPDC050417 TaxID=3364280 RepID=UPI00378760AD